MKIILILLTVLLPLPLYAGTLPVTPVSHVGGVPVDGGGVHLGGGPVPLPVQVSVTVHPQVVYRTRASRPAANSWTHPGDVYSHLRNEHGMRESELAGMSNSDLEWLHSRSHDLVESRGMSKRNAGLAALAEMGVTAEKLVIFGTKPADHSARLNYQSSCPNGMCPNAAPSYTHMTGAQKRAYKKARGL